MKKLIIALTLGASAITAPPALADPPSWAQANGRRDHDERQDRRDDRDDRRDDRRDYRHDERRADYRGQVNRDWRQYRQYSYNRVDPRYGNYYADRYYRDGRYYQPRRLSYNERIYRGNNGRYYCRRSDGTTGLIIGAGAGALLGNALSNGNSGLLGTLLGAGIGGAIGNSVDRGNVTCR